MDKATALDKEAKQSNSRQLQLISINLFMKEVIYRWLSNKNTSRQAKVVKSDEGGVH